MTNYLLCSLKSNSFYISKEFIDNGAIPCSSAKDRIKRIKEESLLYEQHPGLFYDKYNKDRIFKLSYEEFFAFVASVNNVDISN